MLDFVHVTATSDRRLKSTEQYTITPSFDYVGVHDIIVKGGSVYAYWTDKGWSNDVTQLYLLIDQKILQECKDFKSKHVDAIVNPLLIRYDNSNVMNRFVKYLKQSPSSDIIFNRTIKFKDDPISREDYSFYQLNYNPVDGPTNSFDELIGYLYAPEEVDKIMWFMGAALTNSMPSIQKFLYLYGAKGTGKGTVIDIFRKIFLDYCSDISLNQLTNGDAFATSRVQELPVMIDSDSDISKIKDDTNLLKLTAHEELQVNKKFKEPYFTRFDGLLITASNKRYKSRDIDAGINRRVVTAEPTGNIMPAKKYKRLMAGINNEIPSIAYKAMKYFESQGSAKYDDYVDTDMMEATDLIYSFVRDKYKEFGDPTSLKIVSELYKEYLQDFGLDTNGFKRRIKLEMQRYFKHYAASSRIDGVLIKNVYSGFKIREVFPEGEPKEEGPVIELKEQPSKFDEYGKDYPAQYANKDGYPKVKWDACKTVLNDLDTTELHYVNIPADHIVIDFDCKNVDGDKWLEKNLEEAGKFPPTYAETSKSGKGIHLHYIYDGDVSKLARLFEKNIEIKVFTGKQSLRRKLTMCNDLEITHISEGQLPLKKEELNVYDNVKDMVWTEKKMRTSVKKNLRKEYHNATKPSMDFIEQIFKDARAQGVDYDLSDMRGDIMAFAAKSTHNAAYCLRLANRINYSSIKGPEEVKKFQQETKIVPDDKLVFFDLEVYPNLLLIRWKKYGSEKMAKWFNPTAAQVEWLVSQPLVGFNNRRYDNHILYGRLVGESNLTLFRRSQNIINRNGGYSSGAYEISYTDIYDYSNTKQSLKKWEVQLNMLHDEAEFPWDKPLDESNWDRVAEYCGHDVLATEATFKATKADYQARLVLAKLSGLSVNATTQQHAARYLFGDDPRPQDKFVYTDLSKEFPGYTYSYGKSEYRGENPSEGGYVYSEPGIYKNVAEIDISSMHPTSAIELNYFGPYTQRYAELKDAKNYLKHKELDKASKVLNGSLKPFLGGGTDISDLTHAIKIVINIVYGMSSAKFDNPFRNPKNVDNIIAKRGALFMINLKHVVQDAGYTVVHIKTDSIKISNVDDKIIKTVIDYGKKYGYDFEVEHVFDKFALVNKAVNIGHVEDNKAWGKEANTWEAIGAEFAEPYVFKALFSQEEIREKDFAQTKQVKSTIYLDDEFVGKIANVYASHTGYTMTRDNGDGKRAAVTGTKGYLWKLFKDYGGKEDIDMEYYESLVENAVKDLAKVETKECSAWEFLYPVSKEYLDIIQPF
ncbi:DUF5906 domain-containing protein [Liquorilactobacillus hordei]|uniref:DUF5906 domain-containing protein n=1 Tax=Liquorilactobacillus hordei TaxID=468911 RepID=UPI0039ED8554